jgi:hypothetical protein
MQSESFAAASTFRFWHPLIMQPSAVSASLCSRLLVRCRPFASYFPYPCMPSDSPVAPFMPSMQGSLPESCYKGATVISKQATCAYADHLFIHCSCIATHSDISMPMSIGKLTLIGQVWLIRIASFNYSPTFPGVNGCLSSDDKALHHFIHCTTSKRLAVGQDSACVYLVRAGEIILKGTACRKAKSSSSSTAFHTTF